MESMSTVFSTTYESEAEATRACKTVGWQIGFGLRRRNAKPSARAPTYVFCDFDTMERLDEANALALREMAKECPL
ncbi:hypothetical protein HRG_014986 [Hirsutella rhossiliensis]